MSRSCWPPHFDYTALSWGTFPNKMTGISKQKQVVFWEHSGYHRYLGVTEAAGWATLEATQRWAGSCRGLTFFLRLVSLSPEMLMALRISAICLGLMPQLLATFFWQRLCTFMLQAAPHIFHMSHPLSGEYDPTQQGLARPAPVRLPPVPPKASQTHLMDTTKPMRTGNNIVISQILFYRVVWKLVEATLGS